MDFLHDDRADHAGVLRAVIRKRARAIESHLEPPCGREQVAAPQRAVGNDRVVGLAFVGPAHPRADGYPDGVGREERVSRRRQHRPGERARDVLRFAGDEREDTERHRGRAKPPHHDVGGGAGGGGGGGGGAGWRGRSAVWVQITMTPQLAPSPDWNSSGTRELPLYTSIAVTSLG